MILTDVHFVALIVFSLIFDQSKADDDTATASDPSGSGVKQNSGPKTPESEVIVPAVRTGVHVEVPAGKNRFQGIQQFVLSFTKPQESSSLFSHNISTFDGLSGGKDPELSEAPLHTGLPLNF